MIKTILVPIVSSGVDKPSFDTAVRLARLSTGHIDFLYARPDPVTFRSVHGSAFMPGMLEDMRAAAERHHEESRSSYLAACRGADIPTDIVGPALGKVTARWQKETGKVAECVAEHGYASDLIIVERGRDILSAQALEGALFRSGRPVLLPGSQPLSLDTIAIAWKPTREASRAVAAALPLLPHAKRVVIITVSENGAVRPQQTERLATNLMRHHPAVETNLIEAGPFIPDVSYWRRPSCHGCLHPPSVARAHFGRRHREGVGCQRDTCSGIALLANVSAACEHQELRGTFTSQNGNPTTVKITLLSDKKDVAIQR